MRLKALSFTCVILASLMASGLCRADRPAANQALLVLHGKVLDSAGNPLGDASVFPYHDGRLFLPKTNGGEHLKDLFTGRNGLFMIEISAAAETINDGKWSVKITRPSFKPSLMIPLKVSGPKTDETGTQRFLATVSLSMERYQGTAFWIALIVFLLMYG